MTDHKPPPIGATLDDVLYILSLGPDDQARNVVQALDKMHVHGTLPLVLQAYRAQGKTYRS